MVNYISRLLLEYLLARLECLSYDIKYISLRIYNKLDKLDDKLISKIQARNEAFELKIKSFIKCLDKGFDRFIDSLAETESSLRLLSIALTITITILAINIESLNSYIDKMGDDMTSVSDDYIEAYSDLNIAHTEIYSLINAYDELMQENAELQKQIDKLNYDASELTKKQIRTFIKIAAEAYSIDPTLAIAISRHETGNWTSNLCLQSNNFGGIKSGKNWASYDTAMQGINSLCKLLKWYANNNMETIDKMAYTYCPTNTEAWIKAVKNIYQEESLK